MEQENLGKTGTVAGDVVEDVAMLPVETNAKDGYLSESEESEFSMSDSVHYSDSEFECSDDENCSTCVAERNQQVTAEQTENAQNETEDSSEDTEEENLRNVTPEETRRVQMSNRALASINYGPYRIFFDMEIDGNFLGRIIIKLGNDSPLCRNNIDKLCTGKMRNRNNLIMHYTGTKFHRMTDGKFLEGGVLFPLIPEDAESIYNEKRVANPECYDSYVMVANNNIIDDYNGARFIITTTKLVKHYDENHIPVGCVVTGTEVIDAIAALPCDENGYFLQTVTIAHCGSIKQTKEEAWPCGKYEKKTQMNKNSFLYKLYNRKSKPVARNVVVTKSNPDLEKFMEGVVSEVSSDEPSSSSQ